jgi:hypothetical protein
MTDIAANYFINVKGRLSLKIQEAAREQKKAANE